MAVRNWGGNVADAYAKGKCERPGVTAVEVGDPVNDAVKTTVIKGLTW